MDWLDAALVSATAALVALAAAIQCMTQNRKGGPNALPMKDWERMATVLKPPPSWYDQPSDGEDNMGTTDHDPRELREWAASISPNDIRGAALITRDYADDLAWVPRQAAKICADYILATVREDDGEEQEDVTVTIPDGGYVVVNPGGTWLVEYPETTLLIKSRRRPTRGQFRDLCRGLGIEVP